MGMATENSSYFSFKTHGLRCIFNSWINDVARGEGQWGRTVLGAGIGDASAHFAVM